MLRQSTTSNMICVPTKKTGSQLTAAREPLTSWPPPSMLQIACKIV